MEISEAESLAMALAQQITALLQAYQDQTKLLIHSVPVEHAGMTVTARVKIQIREP